MTPTLETQLKKYAELNLTLHSIGLCVAEKFGNNIAAFKNRSRNAELCEARFACYWIARNNTEATMAQIGQFYGGRTHACVVKGVERAQELMDSDAAFKDKLLNAEAAFRNMKGNQ